MKRIITLFFICILLSSCAKNHSSDEYFIHAICFGNSKGKIELSAVCEKIQGDKSHYFVLQESAESLTEITKTIKNKYQNCYFATAELYFFCDNLSAEQKVNLAKELCQSTEYPIKDKSVFASFEETINEFNKIDSEDDIKKLLKEQDTNCQNTAVYLAKFMEGKSDEK